MNAEKSPARVGTVLRTCVLEKEYGRGAGLVRALDGIELEVSSGETVAVMGPSGCGKSTLCICSAAWNAPRPGRCGWRESGSTS